MLTQTELNFSHEVGESITIRFPNSSKFNDSPKHSFPIRASDRFEVEEEKSSRSSETSKSNFNCFDLYLPSKSFTYGVQSMLGSDINRYFPAQGNRSELRVVKTEKSFSELNEAEIKSFSSILTT